MIRRAPAYAFAALVAGMGAACAHAPAPEPDPFLAAAEMRELRVCETSIDRTVCGTWTWDGPNRQYLARWESGAHGSLKLVRYDGATLEVARGDESGATPGLTGGYVARRGADSFQGSVVFNWRGRSWGGTWEARWSAPAQPPSP